MVIVPDLMLEYYSVHSLVVGAGKKSCGDAKYVVVAAVDIDSVRHCCTRTAAVAGHSSAGIVTPLQRSLVNVTLRSEGQTRWLTATVKVLENVTVMHQTANVFVA